MARHVLKEGPDAKISIHSRVNRHNHMSNDIIVSRKDVREALIRTALKDEFFRDSLVANPKLAVERALRFPGMMKRALGGMLAHDSMNLAQSAAYSAIFALFPAR